MEARCVIRDAYYSNVAERNEIGMAEYDRRERHQDDGFPTAWR